MLKKAPSLFTFMLLSCLVTRGQDKNTYVNPFIGTGAMGQSALSGSNFPGATTPFGMVQLSPDTRVDPDSPASGYNYNDHTIVGFTHTHLSGTGISDLFDILFMPTTGTIKTIPGDINKSGSGYSSRFDHQHESAKPGYYQVKLLDYDINAELTATEHAGFHRYTYPANTPGHLVIDMNHSMNKTNYFKSKILDAQIRLVNDHTIEGYRIITGWANMRKIYFTAEFSKAVTAIKLNNEQGTFDNGTMVDGRNIKAVLDFDTSNGNQLLVKVGLSSVSVENARLNLKAEISGWDFDQTAKEAYSKWEKELSSIAIEGTQVQKEIFYTGMYHAFTQPNNIADVNGDYLATDFTVHNSPDKKHYSTFSLWDTYRAAHPLYTLIQPERTVEFINSMLAQYDTYGFLPIWQLWGVEDYCMIGNHAIPVVVDAALKGMKGFDLEKAFEAVKVSSTHNHLNSLFDVYEKYQYMPENLESQSVSVTLETSYDDWCVAQLAKKLGKTEDYTRFMKRAMFFKNVYDQKTGFFRGKDDKGNWLTPFDPLTYGANGNSPYTEGNAWQYLWYVPQDVSGLINMMGGDLKFAAQLDKFFSLKDPAVKVNENASGLIGQYAHGNEPSHHTAYLYDYAGQPWKTQFYVAKISNELYNNSFSGYSGNDDCGQMSAWYIFSAMGFYPVNPASGIYAIGSPALSKAVIHLGSKTFTMTAKNSGKGNIYIQSVKLNGKRYDNTYITHTDIIDGGELEFTMGNKPNKKWGTSIKSRPPVSQQ